MTTNVIIGQSTLYLLLHPASPTDTLAAQVIQRNDYIAVSVDRRENAMQCKLMHGIVSVFLSLRM